MAEGNLTPDWILHQTLAVHQAATVSWRDPRATNANMTGTTPNGENGGSNSKLTLTVLGCGTMGIAILGGIMDSLQTAHPHDHVSTPEPGISGTSTPVEPAPMRLPGRFNACVRRHESAKRVKAELVRYRADLTVYENENLAAVRAADVVLLCVKPQIVDGVLGTDEMREALRGKLLISICAGVPETQIHNILYGHLSPPSDACTIVRAMPNTAAAIRESMTVIATSTPPLPSQANSLVTWIFTRIGRVVHLPPAQMDACTALCGSGPAFAALMLESMAAGAVAMGIPREEAKEMAAQTMRGTTGLVLGGEHPAILREKVSTPGGCTMGGLLVLEEGCIRGTVARAVREATIVASRLGQGKVGMNGTRF